MKKEINSKSKRKWIMGGLAGFASVALLTTGFAVWVIGTSQTEQKLDVDVTVDTAKNNSIVMNLTMGSDTSIKLAEDTAVPSGKIVTVAEGDITEKPLEINYDKITISYGTSYDFKFKSIQFSIAEPETTDDTTYASVKAAGNKLTGSYARTGTNYTYIDAPAAIDLTSYTPATNGNTTTYTLPASTLTFKWGTFFDNKSPATYYNGKYASETDFTVLEKAADEITTELKDMESQLNNKKIKLVATLSETAA